MSKPTSADLFSGCGGVAQGFKQAGFTHAWGLEFDQQIAEIYKANHGDVYVQNILDANPFKFERPDILHASPVCKSYSTANANKGEKQLDIDCAKKVAQFIKVLQPQMFTLENVQAYAKDRAFHIIVNQLYSLGYWVQYQVLNSADFSVPQSRRRLILIAVKDGFIPSLPLPEKHIGWYEAVKDKVHDLPDSQLAEWQLKALPKELTESLLLSGTYSNFGSKKPDIRTPETPCFTQTATIDKHPTRAILIENTGARSDRELQTRTAIEPCWTLRAMGQDGHWHRANALLENAKVKALDIACLARLQSFPDDYQWSGKKSLDGKGIGNSVPPLMYQKILQAVHPQAIALPNKQLTRLAA